ncbi:MAG: 5,6-dimethylbenzimidazole synthase [Candidatus Omnitrophica bacterium]|nr:5,6-dimethylbenzimidazole synthase [Candidatus Omnitrophota bacterium]
MIQFSEQERDAIYKVIFSRRDVREGFLPKPIPEDVLTRILEAAHHAGSVGFMQPWNFIVIDNVLIKQRVKSIFLEENKQASQNYDGERKKLYESLKLEGILEAPINVAITCEHKRGGNHVLGRNTIPETDLFSTCCAIQNLWLAARSEGIGAGWVSIIDPEKVKKRLGIPDSVSLVAYLCLGYVKEFAAQPLLETIGWRSRLPLHDVIFRNEWKQS